MLAGLVYQRTLGIVYRGNGAGGCHDQLGGMGRPMLHCAGERLGPVHCNDLRGRPRDGCRGVERSRSAGVTLMVSTMILMRGLGSDLPDGLGIAFRAGLRDGFCQRVGNGFRRVIVTIDDHFTITLI